MRHLTPLLCAAIALSACGEDKQAAGKKKAQGPGNAEPAFDLGYDASKATPMNERVATLGFLNKRNGEIRDLKMKPGEAVRIGRAIIRLRACERTSPWEQEQLTGAFFQLDVQGADGGWRRSFSGWNYKESPSLNPVQHPIFDVWTKDCQMEIPAAGPNSVTVKGGSAPAATSGAKKSAPAAAAADDSAPAESDSGTDNADDSNEE